ncbi:MAG: signal peptidase I [Methanofollis sp.]|nr:signal peptidase I [Methanofollis sp.]
MISNQIDLITYVGPSMYPTLKPLDLLYCRPAGERSRVRKGDVIVFQHPEIGHIVIHRVIAVTSAGIKTRGDNNSLEDPYLVSPDAVLGLALYARRNGRLIAIRGGYRGRSRAAAIQMRRRAVHIAAAVLRRPCDALPRRCPVEIPFLRVVAFRRTHGTELRLLLGGRSIGHLPAGERRWRIKRPFGIIVNEEALPGPHSEEKHE